jgi:hypothetical protein
VEAERAAGRSYFRRPRGGPALAPALFLAFILLACAFDVGAHGLLAGDPGPSLVPVPQAASVGSPGAALPSSGPEVVIKSPANNSVVTNGAPVTITFALLNFNLIPPNGQPDSPGTGYLNVTVNGLLYEAVWSEAPLVLDLPAGPQAIVLQPVSDRNQTIFPSEPGFLDVEMTHGPNTGVPSVVIWSPTRGESFNNADVTLSFFIADFTIVQPVGQSDAPNEGHIHAYLDGIYFAMITVEQAFIVTDLTPGQHAVELILVNNDHTAYEAGSPPEPISAWTVFNVTGAASPSNATAAEVTTLEYLSLGSLALSIVILVAVVVMRPRMPSRPYPASRASAPSTGTSAPSAPSLDDRE